MAVAGWRRLQWLWVLLEVAIVVVVGCSFGLVEEEEIKVAVYLVEATGWLLIMVVCVCNYVSACSCVNMCIVSIVCIVCANDCVFLCEDFASV